METISFGAGGGLTQLWCRWRVVVGQNPIALSINIGFLGFFLSLTNKWCYNKNPFTYNFVCMSDYNLRMTSQGQT